MYFLDVSQKKNLDDIPIVSRKISHGTAYADVLGLGRSPSYLEFASEKTFTSRRANSQPARYRYLRLRVSCVPASLERVTFTLVASVRVAIRTATATREHKYSRVIVDVYRNYYFAKLPRNNSATRTLSLC